jgi:quercetin dioxygenase-like cupin family protein
MPDFFPTTEEIKEDQVAAEASAGGVSIVNHLGADSFEKDGLRPFFEYRPLGLKELTGGKIGAHVIRAKPGKHADAPRHTHTLDFQFVYVLKGWAIFEYEGYGTHKLVEGSTVYQPPGIKHKEIDHSEDFEVLEITMPADFETNTVA